MIENYVSDMDRLSNPSLSEDVIVISNNGKTLERAKYISDKVEAKNNIAKAESAKSKD